MDFFILVHARASIKKMNTIEAIVSNFSSGFKSKLLATIQIEAICSKHPQTQSPLPLRERVRERGKGGCT
jgi:hypothetical protein